MGKIEPLIDIIAAANKATVLAMIVHVEGSAYRKEGSWMLFKENNEAIGMISGGCLEKDLQKRAEQIFHTGKSEIISYDLSAEDDLGWGRGAGCNGIVHILLRDIDKKFQQAFIAVSETLSKKEPVLFVQSMDDFTKYTFTNKQNDPFGFWDDEADWEWINARPFQKLAGQRIFGNQKYYIQLIWPMPHLYIIGAGMDARPLAQFAHDAGYGVHILDWRKTHIKKGYFPTALSLHSGNVLNLLDEINFSALDAVVVMTHDFELDVKLVRKFQNIPLLYFGILGSKKRTERILGNAIPVHIKTPVGLSIGADGPFEIAISIVAELIARRNGIRL